MKKVLVAAASAAIGLLAQTVCAQDGQTGASGGVTTSTPPVMTSTANTTAPVTVVAAPATPKIDDHTPDHDRFVGRFAVGYLGLNDIPLGNATVAGGAALNLTEQRVIAPTVGVRYWVNKMIGVDAGIGFGIAGGSSESVVGGTSTTVDSPSSFGMALHGGVPLAFSHGRHYSFMLIPEMNIGFSSGTIKGNAPGVPDIDLSGFRLDAGGRVGAELHFGFIGVPELSLQASVGLFFRREAYKAKRDNSSASVGRTTFGTTVEADPWALFTKSISAFYYF